MKKILLPLLLLGSCASVSDIWGNAEIPVSEIESRATTIIAVLKKADLNQDGVIKGDAEWFSLGSGAAQLFVQWAAEARVKLSQ